MDWQSGRLPFFEAPPLEVSAQHPRDQPLSELRVDPSVADEQEHEYLSLQKKPSEEQLVGEDVLDLEQMVNEDNEDDNDDEEDQIPFDDLIE